MNVYMDDQRSFVRYGYVLATTDRMLAFANGTRL